MSLSKETKHLHMMEQDTVLLLIGKTGSGKSATGNIIFNKAVFESRRSSISVTKICQTHKDTVNDRSITVIDTPDFRYSTQTDFNLDCELKRALKSHSPGAHVILLFLPLNSFTEQEMDLIVWFKQTFGVEALRFTLVLFTHADQRHMRSLGDMVRENTQLFDFINQCGQRYHEINIKEPANKEQVTELMEKINRLLSENTNSCYTLNMMLETERRREDKKRREDERRERERQIELDRIRRKTEIRVRRECEEQKRAKLLEEQESLWKGFKHLSVKQIKLKYVCVIMAFAIVMGGVYIWNKNSSNRWMFFNGFITGGSASTAGICIEILWRLMLKNQYVCLSSHESPSLVRQFFFKTGGVVCAASAGAVIGHFLGGNLFPFTVLAGLAGTAAAFTAKQSSC